MFSLISVDRTFKTILNNTYKSGHPCLSTDLMGNAFIFFSFQFIFFIER